MSDARALQLFDELIELAPATRAGRLAALANEDAALHAVVLRMLQADAAHSGLLDGRLDELAAGAALPDRSGQRIGGYRLVARLGRGGMGEVYRAERDGEGFVQSVALKLLRRGVDSEDIVQRFLQERRILARLEHPGIARLIDGGMSADGLPWLAMELVEGETIVVWAQAQARGLRELVTLLVAVCDALDYAHRRLVVHRDLKPSNVLVDADGAPRLLDFGIAKLLDQPPGETLTGTGMQVLSPAYAAPEQLAGEPVGTATDVHALGLLAYELFTGELPQRRRHASLAMLAQELAREPEPPSACARRRAGDGGSIAARQLEGDLDTIVLKALALEPDRRYSSAAALADDLRRYLDGRPIAARPDTLSYRVGKFVRRHRGGVALGVLAALGIFAALVLALWQANVARREAVRAEQQSQRAEREAAAAQAEAQRVRRVKDFMMETFTHANPMRSAEHAPTTVVQAVDEAIARVDARLGDDPRLQIDLRDDFGEILSGQSRYDEARILMDRNLAHAEQVYGRDHPVVAAALINRGSIDYYLDRIPDAVPRFERALGILEKHEREHPMALVNALGAVAAVRAGEGRREEALALTGRALGIQRRYGEADFLRHEALTNHGTNLDNIGRTDEAIPLLREALEIGERLHGRDSPGIEPTLSSLAEALYWIGDVEGSKALNLRRLHIARTQSTAPSVFQAEALTAAGWQEIQTGRHAAGFALLEEAIAIDLALDSDDIVQPLRVLALGKRQLGDHAAAFAAIDRAHRRCSERNALPVQCAVVRADRGAMLARHDPARSQEALADVEAAAAELERLGIRESGETARLHAARAQIFSALCRAPQAEAEQQAALALLRKLNGERHPESVRAQATLESLRAEHAGGACKPTAP